MGAKKRSQWRVYITTASGFSPSSWPAPGSAEWYAKARRVIRSADWIQIVGRPLEVGDTFTVTDRDVMGGTAVFGDLRVVGLEEGGKIAICERGT